MCTFNTVGLDITTPFGASFIGFKSSMDMHRNFEEANLFSHLVLKATAHASRLGVTYWYAVAIIAWRALYGGFTRKLIRYHLH